MQHHKGNADRPDDHGDTIAWLSIYKHGHDGEAEHPLKYTFISFFREDPKTVFKELKRIFDPKNLLNPGKIIGPDPSRPAWPLR